MPWRSHRQLNHVRSNRFPVAFTRNSVPVQLLTADEVHVLGSVIAKRLDAGRDLPFPLTGKLIENAVEGARKLAGARASHVPHKTPRSLRLRL